MPLQRLIDWLTGMSPAGVDVPCQGGYFHATAARDQDGMILGVNVTNLGNNGFLEIRVFAETLDLLRESPNHTARKGNAMGHRLGDAELNLDSIEGRVANRIYGKQVSEIVFRRITPISRILEAAGICESGPGTLILLPPRQPRG